jgi:hypothetical protein
MWLTDRTGWSRPCLTTRIRVFVMRLVNACTYYLSPAHILLALITRDYSGQLHTDLEVNSHAFPTQDQWGEEINGFWFLVQETIQEKYGGQLFTVLLPTLEAPEPRFVIRDCFSSFQMVCLPHLPCRVHSHAAAALTNFCEGVERDALVPCLDPIVARLLKLLNPTSENAKQPKLYVEEQADLANTFI